MELATLLGRNAPYSTVDLFYVYLTRDLPSVAAVVLAAWLFAPDQLFSLGEYLAMAGGLLSLVLSAIVVAPLVETVFFIIFILVIPPRWYQPDDSGASPNGRRIALAAVCGALFGAMHLSTSAFAAIGAAIGGMIMFAVLLQHWIANLRDRGIVMCWALHAVHNALMLLMLAVFHR